MATSTTSLHFGQPGYGTRDGPRYVSGSRRHCAIVYASAFDGVVMPLSGKSSAGARCVGAREGQECSCRPARRLRTAPQQRPATRMALPAAESSRRDEKMVSSIAISAPTGCRRSAQFAEIARPRPTPGHFRPSPLSTTFTRTSLQRANAGIASRHDVPGLVFSRVASEALELRASSREREDRFRSLRSPR